MILLLLFQPLLNSFSDLSDNNNNNNVDVLVCLNWYYMNIQFLLNQSLFLWFKFRIVICSSLKDSFQAGGFVDEYIYAARSLRPWNETSFCPCNYYYYHQYLQKRSMYTYIHTGHGHIRQLTTIKTVEQVKIDSGGSRKQQIVH